MDRIAAGLAFNRLRTYYPRGGDLPKDTMELYIDLFQHCQTEEDVQRTIDLVVDTSDLAFPRYKQVKQAVLAVMGSQGKDDDAPNWRKMMPGVRRFVEEYRQSRYDMQQPLTWVQALQGVHAEVMATCQDMPWDDYWKQRAIALEELLREEGASPRVASVGQGA